jgi:hypothetical protein
MSEHEYRWSAAIQREEDPREKYNRLIGEILDKAGSEGRKLYRDNNLFRSAVEAAVRGKDPWEVVVYLIDCNIELHAKFEKLLIQWPSHENPQL